jgi:dTDP-4-amino-4,6-dideoxygalactose transaminase
MSHLGGIINPDIMEIVELCNNKNIAIVEDCAHSLGATINGLHSGKFGIAGVYSLYATKAISAGEGGIVVTNDHSLGEMLNKFQIYDRFDQIQEIGVNFRISELQALFSLCVSEQSEEIIKNKYNIAKRYADICIKNNIRFIDSNSNGQRGNHYKFTLLAKTSNLEFEKIKSRTSPIYDYSIGNDAESITNKHICLPIWFGLEEELIQKTLSELETLRY